VSPADPALLELRRIVLLKKLRAWRMRNPLPSLILPKLTSTPYEKFAQTNKRQNRDVWMDRLLIVEDDVKDMRQACDAAVSLGFRDIEGRSSLEQTVTFLEAGLQGKCLLPDAIVIDLNLGNDSGYELIRFCYSNPDLAAIPVIVWSVLGEHQRGLCAVFKVKCFVTKGDEEYTLRDALREVQNQAA
jgi:CheY-like chemotaxis protein